MKRLLIFGNSAAGKSTYAKRQAAILCCRHLDLDTIAWEPEAKPPVRRSPDASRSEILAFIGATDDWVIEGCYADLLEVAVDHATDVIFLNPGAATCIENAKRRPWEPHKYATPEAQDANLGMLIDWIRAYDKRTDEFSYVAHRRLFDGFAGQKLEFLSNACGG